MSDFHTHLPSGCENFLRGLLPQEDFESFLRKMEKLQQFLYETNEKFNLTALPPEAFWSKHAADSLSLVKAFPDGLAGKKTTLCDLGCGAGFPSLVLAAAFPCLTVKAVDSTGKKIAFVNAAASELELKNIEGIHARGNELARKPPFTGAFDIVTARAVSSADTLVKEGFGFLKKNGILAVYRTPQQLEEEKPFLNRNRKFTWKATDLFELPENAGTRQFLLITKI